MVPGRAVLCIHSTVQKYIVLLCRHKERDTTTEAGVEWMRKYAWRYEVIDLDGNQTMQTLVRNGMEFWFSAKCNEQPLEGFQQENAIKWSTIIKNVFQFLYRGQYLDVKSTGR